MTGKSDINIDQTTRLAPVYNGWLSFLQRHLKEEDGFHIKIEDLYAQVPPIQEYRVTFFHETRQHKRMALIVTVLDAHQYPSGTCKASRSRYVAFRSKRVNVPVYWLSILRSHFQLGVSHESSAYGAQILIDWHNVEDTQPLQVFLDELVCSRRSEGLRSQARPVLPPQVRDC
jgi:hypothetical protein